MIDYTALFRSCKEVLFLTFLALLPLIINITIAYVTTNNFIEPLKSKIIPGEMLAYCLSFLAPSLYLLTKMQGSTHRLPLLHIFSLTTITVYILSIVLYLIAKNNWVEAINMENHQVDPYYKLTLIFLTISIIFRIYSVYHGKNASNWTERRNKQQNDFNEEFTKIIN